MKKDKRLGCLIAGGVVVFVLGVLLASLILVRLARISAASPANTAAPGNGAPTPVPTQTADDPALSARNGMHRSLMEQSEDGRREFLLAVVRSGAGKPCSRVDRAFFRGLDPEDIAYWSVSCAGGESYQISFYQDVYRSMKVVDCTEQKALSGSDCFAAFPRQRPAAAPASPTPVAFVRPVGSTASEFAEKRNRNYRFIMMLGEDSRQGFLGNFVKERGRPCSGVSRAFFRGIDKYDAVYWGVACTSGESYQVAMPDAGTDSWKILDCRTLTAQTGEDCFAFGSR